MAVAAVTTKPLDTQLAMPFHPPLPKPLQKKRLPAGRPREWYVSHNRRLKAMRLAIALLDTGVYQPPAPATTRYVPPPNTSASTRRPTPRAAWSAP